MEEIKCDLNVHLDGHINEEAVRRVLRQAQDNGVQALSLMEQNGLSLYKENGVLYKMIKSGELEKIYSGKLIYGCELTCVVNKTDSKRFSFDFNGYFVHLTLLNYDIKFMEKLKWFSPEFKQKCIKKDIKFVCKLLKKHGLEAPPSDYFVYDRLIGNQIYDYMKESPERVKQYERKLGSFTSTRDFVYRVFEDPVSELYYKPSYIPYLTEVLEFIRGSHGRVYISHPSRMNQRFNTTLYLDALLNMNTKYGFPFDGIEVYYGYNTATETKLLKDYAISHNLEMSGNSGYKYTYTSGNPQGKIIWSFNGEQLSYTPIPGYMVRSYLETHNGDIMLNRRFIDRFDDIRETSRFS